MSSKKPASGTLRIVPIDAVSRPAEELTLAEGGALKDAPLVVDVGNNSEQKRNEALTFTFGALLGVAPWVIKTILNSVSVTGLRVITAHIIAGTNREKRAELKRLGLTPEPTKGKEKDKDGDIDAPSTVYSVMAPWALINQLGWQSLAVSIAETGLKMKRSGLRAMNAIIGDKTSPQPVVIPAPRADIGII